MPASVTLRTDYSAEELRRLAKSAKSVSQGRRFLSLAAVRDGMSRADAARIGGMDRQTLRDWVHRFNEAGPDGLLDHWSKGPALGFSHVSARPRHPGQNTEIIEAYKRTSRRR